MSTQSLVPVGAYWIFTDAMPRSEVAVALSGTVPVSGEPGLVRLTATVLKSAAVAIDAVEYELAVKSAPDAPAPADGERRAGRWRPVAPSRPRQRRTPRRTQCVRRGVFVPSVCPPLAVPGRISRRSYAALKSNSAVALSPWYALSALLSRATENL